MRIIRTITIALLLVVTSGAKPAPVTPPPQDYAVTMYWLLFTSMASVCGGNPTCIACASCIASQASGYYPAGSSCSR